MENPIKMDDLGVPLFSETSICIPKTQLSSIFWVPTLQKALRKEAESQ